MLSSAHEAFLAERAVTGDIIERRGYRTITDWRELCAVGFPETQAKKLSRGLLIPRYGLDGKPSWPKFRPDNDERRNGPVTNSAGKEIKYASPGASWNFVDALPGTRLKGGDIWLSAEGFIKADAMTKASGFPVVAIDGVYGWRSSGDTVLGLEALAWRGRWFHIVCDSDIDTNPRVATAMFRLAAWLRSRDCKARILHPPTLGPKVGVDDFLADGNHLAQLVAADRPTKVVSQAWACSRLARALRTA